MAQTGPLRSTASEGFDAGAFFEALADPFPDGAAEVLRGALVTRGTALASPRLEESLSTNRDGRTDWEDACKCFLVLVRISSLEGMCCGAVIKAKVL
jgi:hypothetical protein